MRSEGFVYYGGGCSLLFEEGFHVLGLELEFVRGRRRGVVVLVQGQESRGQGLQGGHRCSTKWLSVMESLSVENDV